MLTKKNIDVHIEEKTYGTYTIMSRLVEIQFITGCETTLSPIVVKGYCSAEYSDVLDHGIYGVRTLEGLGQKNEYFLFSPDLERFTNVPIHNILTIDIIEEERHFVKVSKILYYDVHSTLGIKIKDFNKKIIEFKCDKTNLHKRSEQEYFKPYFNVEKFGKTGKHEFICR